MALVAFENNGFSKTRAAFPRLHTLETFRAHRLGRAQARDRGEMTMVNILRQRTCLLETLCGALSLATLAGHPAAPKKNTQCQTIKMRSVIYLPPISTLTHGQNLNNFGLNPTYLADKIRTTRRWFLRKTAELGSGQGSRKSCACQRGLRDLRAWGCCRSKVLRKCPA